MLLVDRATGSRELLEPLLALGLPAELESLAFGDLVFSGRGEGGAHLTVGIEYKKLPELVQSLRSKRFQGHQLLGLTREYDRRYLLVEGLFHHDSVGRPTIPRGTGRKPIPGASNAITLEQELLNIATRGGCAVIERMTQRDALRWVQACYRYWTDKDLDEHKSHLAMYAPDMDTALKVPMSDFRVGVNNLLKGEGLGMAGSKALEAASLNEKGEPSMRRLCLWSVEQWAALEVPDRNGKVKRLGRARAERIMEKLG
jgi:hypothetical protein